MRFMKNLSQTINESEMKAVKELFSNTLFGHDVFVDFMSVAGCKGKWRLWLDAAIVLLTGQKKNRTESKS